MATSIMLQCLEISYKSDADCKLDTLALLSFHQTPNMTEKVTVQLYVQYLKLNPSTIQND